MATDPIRCPHCGAKISNPDARNCPICGRWLRPGRSEIGQPDNPYQAPATRPEQRSFFNDLLSVFKVLGLVVLTIAASAIAFFTVCFSASMALMIPTVHFGGAILAILVGLVLGLVAAFWVGRRLLRHFLDDHEPPKTQTGP